MNKNVFVLGSYVTDLCSRSTGFPEVGETIKGLAFSYGPGGKGSNQAVAAFKAGANVRFSTKVGKDIFGDKALSFYQEIGMSTDWVQIDPNAQTGAALIMVDERTSQNQIIVIGGACENISETDTKNLYQVLEESAIFLTQLETNLKPVYEMLSRAHEKGITTILNPAPAQEVELELFKNIDVITPNETEAEFFTGIKVVNQDSASLAAKKFHEWGVKNVVITMGEHGAFLSDDNIQELIPAANCGKVVDTTGAGDAFSGGLAAGLAEGKTLYDAVRYATVVAGLSVTKKGTAPAMPNKHDIQKKYTELYGK